MREKLKFPSLFINKKKDGRVGLCFTSVSGKPWYHEVMILRDKGKTVKQFKKYQSHIFRSLGINTWTSWLRGSNSEKSNINVNLSHARATDATEEDIQAQKEVAWDFVPPPHCNKHMGHKWAFTIEEKKKGGITYRYESNFLPKFYSMDGVAYFYCCPFWNNSSSRETKTNLVVLCLWCCLFRNITSYLET